MNQDWTAEEQAWRDSAGSALRDSEQRLDAVTVARLRAIRARVVSSDGLFRATGFQWAVPLALAASLLAVAIIPRLTFDTAVRPQVNVVEITALEVLTDEMGPEFYENLDLYLWLEETGGSA